MTRDEEAVKLNADTQLYYKATDAIAVNCISATDIETVS